MLTWLEAHGDDMNDDAVRRAPEHRDRGGRWRDSGLKQADWPIRLLLRARALLVDARMCKVGTLDPETQKPDTPLFL